MGDILVIGSYNRDTVLRVPRFPRAGETLAALTMNRFHGGKGSNQAVAAARAGASVAIVAAIGADEAGEAARGLWGAEGVDASAVRTRPEVPTGEAVILLDAAGENEIVIVSGANATLAAADAVAAVKQARIVLAQMETPPEATLAAFRAARAAGVTTVLNAAPAEASAGGLLEATDILVVNETEAEILAGHGGEPAALAEALASRVARGVVLTAGAAGAFWVRAGQPAIHAPPLPTEVLDSTGAGDAFVGAMVAGLAEGLAMEGSVRRGAIAGALACRRLGAVPSLPRRQEILAAGD